MEMDLGKRLNILTGDNGLGKSFLLDVMWWALTKKWLTEVNNQLPAGFMAQPSENEKHADICFTFNNKNKKFNYSFQRQKQRWEGESQNPDINSLVLYSQANDCFAVWDPIRNNPEISNSTNHPAFVFTQREVWDGLFKEGSKGKTLCNGLISDWAGWQKEKGEAYKYLCDVLSGLSPSENEKMEPGELTRISTDDVRDIPTIKMPYNQSVPVLHTSSGIRRILAISYLLVWSWEEHKKACKITGQEPASQIIFLIDEIENHLHPRWQRVIVRSLMDVIQQLIANTDIQIILTTHSPLVMASIEPLYDKKTDAWFDLDYEKSASKPNVILTKRDYDKHGDAAGWLTSEAFDLTSSRSVEAEELINRASKLVEENEPDLKEIKKMRDELAKSLDSKDTFLFRWRAICERKGWLK
jgi:predicted ATPase